MTEAEQILCFSAGANTVFTGKKMRTTKCNGWDEDKAMFEKYGLVPMKSFERGGYQPQMTRERVTRYVALIEADVRLVTSAPS